MGMNTSFQIVNGTSYHEKTPDAVIRVMENARQNRTRLHVSLGFTDGSETGKDWLEENDVYGYIGRSTGPIKVPLLIPNRRSLGGGAILDHCIVRIRQSAGGRVLYQHPKYHFGELQIRWHEPVELPDGRVLTVDILRDGEEQASFENMTKVRRYLLKLGLQPIST